MRTVPTLVEFSKTVKEGIKDSTRSTNEAIEGLTKIFPGTAHRVVSHGTDERSALNPWASSLC